MTALFVVCAAFCAYTHVGFPALPWLRLRLRGVRATSTERQGGAGGASPDADRARDRTSPVSVVVAAHDEFDLLASLAGPDHRVANFVRVFVQLNAAAVVGAWRWAGGGTGALWKRPAGAARARRT